MIGVGRRNKPGWCAVLATVAGLALAPAASATADDLRSIAAMRMHNRVLLVFAPRLDDPRLKAQDREFAHAALGMAERDVILVQVGGDAVIGAHDDAAKLRRRHHVGIDDYRTLLIGKDGNTALTIVGPISAEHLQARIDTMPMRRDEVRRVREGKGKDVVPN